MPSEFYAELADDLGDIGVLVKEELAMGWRATEVLAEIRQRNIKAACDRVERGFVEGLGQHVARIDADAYFGWAALYPGCWSDSAFRREYFRDNPQVKVNSTPKSMIIRP